MFDVSQIPSGILAHAPGYIDLAQPDLVLEFGDRAGESAPRFPKSRLTKFTAAIENRRRRQHFYLR